MNESTFEVLFHVFGRSIFRERGSKGGIIGGSLPSAVAHLVWMPAGRESKRAKTLLLFEFPPFRFHELGG